MTSFDQASGEPAPSAKTPDPTFAAQVRFRCVRPEDVAAVVSLINEAYMREAWLLPPPRTTAADLTTDIASPRTRVIIAEASGALAGSITLWLRDDAPEFGMLATAPSLQGRGLARLLITEAERVARLEGCTVLTLRCARELGMPPFYASLGYEVAREDVGAYFGSKGPITMVTMQKTIS